MTALENLSLEIPEKQFAVIVGPSGCGKSSLLNLVAGLTEVSQGSCHINKKLITEPGADRGMVFQNYSLFPWLTVRKNVEFGLSLQKLSARERSQRVDHYINAVGLNGFEDAYSNQLSGGMQQRAAIARALANDPDVLLMDEPFGALDSQTRTIMQRLLLDVWENEQKTVLFITHDIDEALFLGDVVYVMSKRPGTIIDSITVELERPRHYEVVTDDHFIKLKRKIMAYLHREVEQNASADSPLT
ncbi:MAG: ABC transporter ATP-binding protein [Acidiferrobacterales bacterium]|nr:ABC transporter ATP-binding protein [Acidiferrobacterales bacterium]